MVGKDNDIRDAEALPDGWVWTTLGEIRIDKSSSITPKKTPNRQYELYSVPSFREGKPGIVPGGQIGSSKRVVEEKVVLLCKINPRINRVWVVGNYSSHSKIASTEWIPFFQVKGVDPDYLCYFMQQSTFKDFLALRASGVGGSLMRIKPSTIVEYPFPLAPLPEQRRIVAEIETQFTRLEAGVAALRRAQANLRRYRASVLKAACEGRLVPTEAALARAEGRDYEPADALLGRVLAGRRARWEAEHAGKRYKVPASSDTEGLPELPEGWVWVAVEQIGEVRLGRQRAPSHHQGPFMRPYLRAANATWDGVDLSDVKEMNFSPKVFETYRLQKEDILLSEASGSPEEVGKPFVWNEEIPDCCFQNTLIRVRLFNLPSSFAYMHFLKDARTGRFATIARGVGIHHLGASRLSVFPIAMPPLAEQYRIVAEVERRLSVVGELEKQVEAALRRAERLRQAVLKRAFEGRLVPQDPADEPASALLARIRAGKAGREAGKKPPKRGRRKRTRNRVQEAEEEKPQQKRLL